MRKILAILALLGMPVTVLAQPKHWWSDKKWWIGEAVIVTATSLDANSTCGALKRNPGGVERNILLPAHPSCGQVLALEAGATGYWTAIHALDWHFFHDDPGKGWRVFGYTAIPAAAAAIHVSAAVHNYGIKAPAAATAPAEKCRKDFELRMEGAR